MPVSHLLVQAPPALLVIPSLLLCSIVAIVDHPTHFARLFTRPLLLLLSRRPKEGLKVEQTVRQPVRKEEGSLARAIHPTQLAACSASQLTLFHIPLPHPRPLVRFV